MGKIKTHSPSEEWVRVSVAVLLDVQSLYFLRFAPKEDEATGRSRAAIETANCLPGRAWMEVENETGSANGRSQAYDPQGGQLISALPNGYKADKGDEKDESGE